MWGRVADSECGLRGEESMRPPWRSFYGTETYAIDHKGRIGIPAAMRARRVEKRSARSFSRPRFEGCLALYTDDMDARRGTVAQIPMGGRNGRAFTRTFLLDASRVSVDAQGRVTIPPALLSRAGLGKEAILHGLVDRIEIWNPERLETEIEERR